MRYLSAAWLTEADRAVRAATWPPDDSLGDGWSGLTIDQTVVGTATWRTVLGPDGCRIDVLALLDDPPVRAESAGAAEPADLVFNQDRDTATAVARGELSAHQAFLLGRIEFRGRVDVLIAARPALVWLTEALKPVIAATTWE